MVISSMLLLSGCIKATPVLLIKADGSGLLEINYSVSEASINQMQAMAKLKQQMAMASGTALPASDSSDFVALIMNPDENALKAKAESYRSLGLALNRIKITSKNAWRFVELSVSFSDLKKLAQADFFRENGFNLTRRHDGSYLLVKPAARQKDPNQQLITSSNKELVSLAPIMSGFFVNVRFEFPGRMIDTNAHGKGLNSAEWKFEFDKDPDALTKMQQQEFRVIFDGNSLNLPDISMNSAAGISPPAAGTEKPGT